MRCQRCCHRAPSTRRVRDYAGNSYVALGEFSFCDPCFEALASEVAAEARPLVFVVMAQILGEAMSV